MISRMKILVVFLLIPFFAIAQNNPLENYIQEGLKNNIVLQQKNISLEQATYALKSATGLFMPSVSIMAGYTHGEGGRSIFIPVGDLMNPVYKTLNQLTNMNLFPQIDNVKESFFPYKFYDVKVRTSMPVLNTDIIFNRQIKDGQVKLKEYEVEMYKKELVMEIKTAYYNYLSSLDGIKIYKSALNVAKEAKRVNESLLKNGAGLSVYLLRTESELENLEAQLLEAQTKSESAKKYFNFILNRDLNENIETMETNEQVVNSAVDESSILNREEIKMLNEGIEINRSLLNMNKYFWVPKISGFLDLGAQDSNWHLNKDSRYSLFGIQLEIPLFEGFRNNNKIESAALDLKSAELELAKTTEALRLSTDIAKNDLLTAVKNYRSSLKQLAAAKSYFKLISKGYREGVNSFIETVDARSQLTNAMLLTNISKYKVFIARAKFERETSSTKF